MSAEEKKGDLEFILSDLSNGLAGMSMERPKGMEGIPVGIPYSEYENYYDQIVSDPMSCVYVAVHKLNDALMECQELLADCDG